jgi:hypothetical protein
VTADLSASLPDYLPPGRVLGAGPSQFWLSDGPAVADLYRRLFAEHPKTGLWPVITDDEAWGRIEELEPEPVADIDLYQPLTVLQRFWAEVAPVEGEDEVFGDDGRAEFAPYGADFPGLAPAGEQMAEPEAVVDWFAGEIELGPKSRILLAPAARGADLPAVVGWTGPMNHTNQMAPLLAIVRSWEDRYGVRVVQLGFDTLGLTVAAPPTTPEHAVQVAAEHVAFCPDNMEQGPGTLLTYAEQVQGTNSWSFWWD